MIGCVYLLKLLIWKKFKMFIVAPLQVASIFWWSHPFEFSLEINGQNTSDKAHEELYLGELHREKKMYSTPFF